jgi:hypothetical protein
MRRGSGDGGGGGDHDRDRDRDQPNPDGVAVPSSPGSPAAEAPAVAALWAGPRWPKPEGLLVGPDSALFNRLRSGGSGSGSGVGPGTGVGGLGGLRPRFDPIGPVPGGGSFRGPVPMHPGGLDGVGFCDGSRFGLPNPDIAKPPAF